MTDTKPLYQREKTTESFERESFPVVLKPNPRLYLLTTQKLIKRDPGLLL